MIGMFATAQENNIFHAYDIRGFAPIQLDAKVAYKLAHAYFHIVPGERYVIGYDMRETSPELFRGFVIAAQDLNKQLVNIGMVTTDMVHYATGAMDFDGGIMITASHNPKQWNGMKLERRGAIPIHMPDLQAQYEAQQVEAPHDIKSRDLNIAQTNINDQYFDHVLSFADLTHVPPLKIVVDAANGMTGPNAKKLFDRIPQIQLINIYCEPNPDFPHHEANPAIAANTTELSDEVLEHEADFGIAFDGDGDRCFFVDDKGEYIPGHYTAGMLARIMIEKSEDEEPAIVYDYRTEMPMNHEVFNSKARAVRVQVGHSFYKQLMREQNAVFGGEASGHYYFRDNFYSDNGLIPVVLMLEYLSKTGQKMSELFAHYKSEFFYSGEHNFLLKPGTDIRQIYDRLMGHFHGEKAFEPDGLVMEFDGWRLNARPSNTEPKVRVTVEANSQVQMQKAIVEVHEVMSNFGDYQGNQSMDTVGMTTEQKFDELINNLWFSWNHHHILPFSDLYGDTWRKNPPPGTFTSTYGKKWYEDLLELNSWRIDQNLRLLWDYLAKKTKGQTWFHQQALKPMAADYRALLKNPIAYLCMEYGLIDWLQIYSGGLGVLAGDFMKVASDMGVPLVGVGIFYSQGYFHQDIDDTGYQQETYLSQDPEQYPIELVKDENGNPIEVSIEIVDHDVWVRAWRLKVGRNDLILLDTNFERNQDSTDRMISYHLYGGNEDTRIRQEILLGIGGPRMLRAMGVSPSIYHMNEGHSGFLVLEIARRYIEEKGMNFQDAIKLVGDHLVFTNHTLKQAGNDIFPYHLIQKYFNTYLDNLNTSLDSVFELGKDQLYAQGKFSMTVLGLRNAKISNAVSQLHGKAAKKLWPDHSLVAVTNGVHMPTWVSPEIHDLLDKYVGENWHFPEYEVDFSKINDIPDEELWQAHMERKRRLISSINDELSINLRPEALTIAWARRLASYKRPDLITYDVETLAEIVNNADRPVQFLYAGKAHPRDTVGKEMLQRMCNLFQEPRFKNKVVIVPGYNWQLARRLVSGADIWLNTPFRYEEASGTSGMKAAANGVLQFTTLDGWTDEVDWNGKGWIIDEHESADSLYSTLRDQIVPEYFNFADQGYNSAWVQKMKASMIVSLERYSMKRMMKEYLEHIYLPMMLESSEFDTSKQLD